MTTAEEREYNAAKARKHWALSANVPERVARRQASNRKGSLKRNFNMTPDQYAALSAKCGNRCCICGTSEPGRPRWNYLPVDHDHETGAWRGVLCHQCNSGLGMFKDSIELLYAAIEYLTYHMTHKPLA